MNVSQNECGITKAEVRMLKTAVLSAACGLVQGKTGIAAAECGPFPDFSDYSNFSLYINTIQRYEDYLDKLGEDVDFVHTLKRELGLYYRSTPGYKLPYDDSDIIYFHDVDQKYGFLSNFSRHPVFVDGIIWHTVEHYYQAQKFKVPDLKEKIRLTTSPVRAKKIARANNDKKIDNWSDVKEHSMYKGLEAKFLQHPDIGNQLILTENRILSEYSSVDSYWGDPGDGTGENRLGQLLMKIRDELINRGMN